MSSPIDFLLEQLAEIERLLDSDAADRLERICAAALQIVLRAPSGHISKVASTVATSARLWTETPAKREFYERPLRTSVKNLRQALESAEPAE